MHYGILGMKWGIRRYQNKDGSLTDAGRKRYDVEEGEKAEKAKRMIRIRSTKKSTNYSQDDARNRVLDISDDDLRKTINRLELEKRYKELTTEKVEDGHQKYMRFMEKLKTGANTGVAIIGFITAFNKLRGAGDSAINKVKDASDSIKSSSKTIADAVKKEAGIKDKEKKKEKKLKIAPVSGLSAKVAELNKRITAMHSDERTNYLAHYGIRGQRHGVRRFQNEDGSYTAAGRQRYGIGKNGMSVKDYRSDKAELKDLRKMEEAANHKVKLAGYNKKTWKSRVPKNSKISRYSPEKVEEARKIAYDTYAKLYGPNSPEAVRYLEGSGGRNKAKRVLKDAEDFKEIRGLADRPSGSSALESGFRQESSAEDMHMSEKDYNMAMKALSKLDSLITSTNVPVSALKKKKKKKKTNFKDAKKVVKKTNFENARKVVKR